MCLLDCCLLQIAISLEKCIALKKETSKEGKKNEHFLELCFEEDKPHVRYLFFFKCYPSRLANF